LLTTLSLSNGLVEGQPQGFTGWKPVCQPQAGYFTRSMITGGDLFAGAAATPLRLTREPRRGSAFAEPMAAKPIFIEGIPAGVD
jgi:hypothetical protein